MTQNNNYPPATGNIDGQSPPETFPDRLAAIIGKSSVRAFARKAGVSDTFLRQCLAGRTEPTRTKLLAIAHAGGVTVEWLATGGGGGVAEGAGAYRGLQRELLETVILAIETALAETGLSISPAKKARLITDVYTLHLSRPEAPVSSDQIQKMVSETN